MGIKDYIQVTENTLPIETISSLIKFCGKLDFKKGGLSEQGIIDENIRKVEVHGLSRLSESLTEIHWLNLLVNIIKQNTFLYKQKFPHFDMGRILDISVLKYQDSGHYDWHTDHSTTIPRTLSTILLLNNDYVGGELCFKDEISKEEMTVETKPGRMIIWPSNFMFPHKVNPVKKGVRYSIVSWTL